MPRHTPVMLFGFMLIPFLGLLLGTVWHPLDPPSPVHPTYYKNYQGQTVDLPEEIFQGHDGDTLILSTDSSGIRSISFLNRS